MNANRPPVVYDRFEFDHDRIHPETPLQAAAPELLAALESLLADAEALTGGKAFGFAFRG